LVHALHEQAERLGAEYEILLIDDCSTDGCRLVNSELANLSRVRYIELAVNIGRSAIRNRLSHESSYRYLVFMDCDAQLVVPDYLSNYLKLCYPGIVCYGGKRDLPSCPDPRCYLRWLYGSVREDAPPEQRRVRPYSSFRAFNFLIDKELFRTVSFDETLKTYGHEDTMLALMLEEQNIKIQHVDNPLLYSGYDTPQEFIRKTEEGVRNLVRLQKTHYGDRLTASIRLLRAARYLRKLRLNSLYHSFFRIFRKSMLANLNSPHPSLFIFDLYKLGLLTRSYD
jgi:glycosyltransferase involved in cell wall biosynthesis